MKWKIIGKILILDKNEKNLSKEYLDKLLINKNVKTIIQINNIYGSKRQPNIKVLAGNETETIHKENGCLFKLDLSKIMWSKGNTHERIRIAKEVKENEKILDMFAGIGYFSIPIGIHSKAKEIYSIEINPDSYKYLKENIELNKINNNYERIKAILGDCKDINFNFNFDRIIMGYVKTTHYYLKSAIDNLKKGGILHYHETVPEKIMNERPINRLVKIAGSRDVELLHFRKIKKYSPGVVHVVLDVKIH